MAKMIPPPHSLATGVGALPHTDPLEACDDVLAIFPEFPYVPTLPDRSQLESIVFNDSEQLPGRVIREDRLLFDSSRDQTAAMETVYMDYVEGNYAAYGLHREYASAFIEMMSRRLSGVQVLKCQVTGPVTFGMQVVDANKRPIYYDTQLADVLSKMIALKARWCEEEMKKKTGVSETLVVLNEPYLASLGSSVVPVDRETVRTGWEDIAALVEGGLGIHCCSNTDWEFVLGLNPSVVSLDAYATAKEFLLYTDAIISYMERGASSHGGLYRRITGSFQRRPWIRCTSATLPSGRSSQPGCRRTSSMRSHLSPRAAASGLPIETGRLLLWELQPRYPGASGQRTVT